MTRNEQQMYYDISSIAKSLEKIADALEDKAPITTKEIPGFEGTLDALDVLCDIKTITDDYASKNNKCTCASCEENPTTTFSNKELHEQKLHTDDGYQDDDDIHNDYLNDLVQGMNQLEFIQFHSQMEFQFASNDSTAMSDAIYELEYEECLGAIKTANYIKENKQD